MNRLKMIGVLSVTVPRKQFSAGSESGIQNRLSDFHNISQPLLYVKV